MTPVIEHVNESWDQRHNKNLHFLFYEDMKKVGNPIEETNRNFN